jgi:hypothetical protein
VNVGHNNQTQFTKEAFVTGTVSAAGLSTTEKKMLPKRAERIRRWIP